MPPQPYAESTTTVGILLSLSLDASWTQKSGGPLNREQPSFIKINQASSCWLRGFPLSSWSVSQLRGYPDPGHHRRATCPGGYPERSGAASHPKVQDRSGWDGAEAKSQDQIFEHLRLARARRSPFTPTQT